MDALAFESEQEAKANAANMRNEQRDLDELKRTLQSLSDEYREARLSRHRRANTEFPQ